MLYGIHTASSSNLIWEQSAKLRTLPQRKACWSDWRPLVTNCFLIQGVRKYVSKCNVGAWPQRPPSCRPISSVHRELSINADCTGSDTTLRYPALPLVRRGHMTTASACDWPASPPDPTTGLWLVSRLMELVNSHNGCSSTWSEAVQCTLTLRITCYKLISSFPDLRYPLLLESVVVFGSQECDSKQRKQ